ncbi:MAG: C10 family peptidase [Lachnospiraceae bacterium]|nr:C10 family peptidase [Lachnospiraceae bacterium]
MKNFLILVLSATILSACSNIEELKPQITNTSQETITSTHISKSDAVEIAKNLLHQTSVGTRSTKLNEPTEFKYVMSRMKTRANVNLSDTLAYIINFPDDAGYVIVASDNRINPILAFSEEGNFDPSNELVQQYFIDKIEPYMIEAAMSDDGYTYNTDNFYWDSCVRIENQGSYGLHQLAPYNKYIAEEHPGYPAGCVTIAVANIISQAKAELNDYHGMTFSPRAARNAMKKEWDAKNALRKKIVPAEGYYIPTYTYDEALEYICKLIYWLSKDLEIEFKVDKNGGKGGYGDSNKAKPMFEKLGLYVPFGLSDCNLNDIVYYLTNNYTIYMRGTDVTFDNNWVGHAWVCDGCYFCYDQSNLDENGNYKKRDIFIHCDWGWSEKDVSYFNGDLLIKFNFELEIGHANFKMIKYFPVQCDKIADPYSIL